MNRNIMMLILLVLVIATVLIAYNKWIMDENQIAPVVSTRQVVLKPNAQVTGKPSALVEEDIADTTSTEDVSVQNSIVHSTGDAQALAPNPSVTDGSQVASSDNISGGVRVKIKKDAQPVLRLVTKKVLIVENGNQQEPADSASVSASAQADSVKSQLSSISSVSYASETLTVSTAASFTYRIFGLKGPDRFVVDVIGSFDKKLPTPIVLTDGKVGSVRLGLHADRVRIVLDLKNGLPENWSASQAKGRLVVDLKKE